MRGLFITGTDTGAGKSVLSACLLASMAREGEAPIAYKPVLTGLDEPAPASWPADDELLALAAGMAARDVAPLRFGPAVSPHLAAALAGSTIDVQALIERARSLAASGTLIIEGVGGLLVPLTGEVTVRDLAAGIGLPVLIAARPGLGTISHSLLTLEAARAAGLDVRALVITPWPAQPGEMESSNRETIGRLGRVPVHTLAQVSGPGRGQLADAGGKLPWREWLAAG
jgi:dethiobiotin synthetase